MNQKICVGCGEEKLLTAFSFSPNSSAPDKLSIYCIACGAAFSDAKKARLVTAHWRKNRREKLALAALESVDNAAKCAI